MEEKIVRCPECGTKLNDVGYGWFCKECCKEWDWELKFIAPLGAHMRGQVD